MVFLESGGTLVDEILEDSTGAAPTFLAGILVKTQFAGPGVHAEVCDFLAEARDRFAPGLAIDDETGFLGARDAAALARAFDEGWAGIRAKVVADRPAPGARFQVGEFPFEVPRGAAPGGEFGAVSGEHRALVLSADSAFVGRFGGFGTTLDHTRRSVLDLELAISDVDEASVPKDPPDAATQEVAFAAGAYFGRTLVAVLGGAWKVEDGQLVVADVGRSGLVVDPFQVARDRVVNGPPCSFAHHVDVYERIAANLAREPAG
jgi:hypothetical protein